MNPPPGLPLPDGYDFESRVYPNAALGIICCAGLHTDCSEEKVAEYFQNGGLEWWGLNSIVPGEISRLFSELQANEHWCYVYWRDLREYNKKREIEKTMLPLLKARKYYHIKTL